MRHPNIGLSNLVFFLLLFSWCSLSAQSSKLQVGVAGEALLHTVNGTPLHLGSGSSLGLWLQQPINPQQGIRLAFAYRVQNDYRLSTSQTYEGYFPRELRRSIQSTQVSSLHHIDASLSWEYQPSSPSPWTFSLGARLAYLSTWRGNQETSTYVTGDDYFQIGGSSGGGTYAWLLSNEKEDLSRSDFQSWDGGLQLYLRYQLSKGLQVQAGVYQGLQSLFQPHLLGYDGNFFATSFSLGFSARLF